MRCDSLKSLMIINRNITYKYAFSCSNKWDHLYTYAENNQSYNKTLYNAIANIIYTPVKNVDLGAEYTYGQRETFAGDKGDLSRINFLTRYSF
ncbi:DcaP family trimeric outer membrane transporter [Acinetobacter ursingii]|uniref:DcaP family trimeric outer membrane transporter n=1 Tax=Acinetobacter ursingii TaxID=108980 RepID=UPI00325E6F31